MSKADYQVQSLARGLEIIELFDAEHRILSTHDFADRLGVSQSSVYRIIQTLLDKNYLRKVARNAYTLGPQVVSRGFAFLAGQSLVDVAAPHLKRLRDETSISCHLAVRDGLETLYIYRAQASQRLSVNIPLGTRLPCHTNAMGRILLQQLSDVELSAVYNSIQLDMYPNPHPQTLPELRHLIAVEKKQGFSHSRSDNASAIAVPITDYLGNIIAAINISGAEQVMDKQHKFEAAKTSLMNTAKAISSEVPV
ncbi:IclR family transcriptional regulator [Veronia pacifica]|uniref:IclR family transcriptional regulator n=1 Tax=Veronia pacifica TaxID=1080227 RepID=A0A1C3ER18_9GAMM|nr:IclR family transcriptional regulator [Veronia pacifica]ODA35681.1 IclR family transcriptional regulator [Veronia pacifica]